ncbi:hypothetical protein HRG_012106 [Hirsutella rhossiliensis]
MASHSQGIVSDKNSRTQAYANRMKRGKIVRPRGEFITSSSMADITREYEELQAKQTRLQTRQEIRMHLKRGARSDPTSPTYRYVVVARQ